MGGDDLDSLGVPAESGGGLENVEADLDESPVVREEEEERERKVL